MVTTTVLVADSQPLFAESLAFALGLHPEFDVLPARPISGRQALEAAGVAKPGIVLIDYWMTGMEGPAIARTLSSKSPDTKVVLLGWFHGPREIRKAVAAGVAGFLEKDATIAEAAAVLRRAESGRWAYPQRFWPLLKELQVGSGDPNPQTPFPKLTPREIEVLENLTSGKPNREIAAGMSISPATLRNHINRILEKTGARTQIEAIAMARTHGLISP